jgi:eukaryotic-like serine/threonine-protein kinase
MTLKPDTFLRDRYRILHLLGKGGMGEVYLAEDTSLKIQVAVKANHRQGEEATNQFFREARLLATLRHPNLPRVIDYFVHEDSQFLVMDFIQGEDLRDYIEKSGPQPYEKVIDWASQLGKALVYLHTQSPPVIHRDIKPANIKLTPQGEVILVDFGIAKATDSIQVTVDGASGYTPGFAPPEQYGSARTGPDSDQFSFAATLYMLLTGQRPTDAVERGLNQAVLTPMNLLVPGIPPHVQAAIEKALSPRREDRFASVDLFLQAINTTPPIPQEVPATQAIPGHSARPTHDATIAASRPATTPPGSSVQPPPITPNESPARKNRWIWGIGGAVVLFGICLLVGGFLVFRTFLGQASQTTSTLASPTSAVALIQITDTVPPAEEVHPTTTVTIASAPIETPTLEPSHTPTPEPSPTATLVPIGGGGAVVFSSDRGEGPDLQLWRMQISLNESGIPLASQIQQLTFDPGDKTQPAWSPDGTRLAYVAPGGRNESGQDLGLDIWVANADGSNPLNLTNRRGDDLSPAWSADGQWIAFTYDGRDDGVLQLYLIAADGSGLRRLSIDQFEFSPTWTPDMRWMMFVLKAHGHNILYMRTAEDDYTELTRYDRGEVLGRQGNVEHPAVSPDGSYIAYTRLDGSRQEIFIVRFASRGADMTQLTAGSIDREPVWSPDSNWIVFTSERDGNPEVYIMDTGGQIQINLSNHAGVDMQPAWQPMPGN